MDVVHLIGTDGPMQCQAFTNCIYLPERKVFICKFSAIDALSASAVKVLKDVTSRCTHENRGKGKDRTVTVP